MRKRKLFNSRLIVLGMTAILTAGVIQRPQIHHHFQVWRLPMYHMTLQESFIRNTTQYLLLTGRIRLDRM